MVQPPRADADDEARPDSPILVVDDDARIRQALEALLVDEGYAVAMAADGQQALAVARDGAPALVLLDMTLPILDGFQVAAKLRADHGSDVPIVVMSADGHVAEKARLVHAVAYLRKPFRLDDLVALVRMHARRGT